MAGALKEGRSGFEETAYLLLLGRLPNAAELESFKNQLAYYRTLPGQLRAGCHSEGAQPGYYEFPGPQRAELGLL